MSFRVTIFFISLVFVLIACSGRVCFAQEVSKNKVDKTKIKTAIPNTIGLKLQDGRSVLQTNEIYIGAIIYNSDDSTDSLDQFIVYKQNPPSKKSNGITNYLKKNRLVDLWIADQNYRPDTVKKHVRRAIN